MKPLSQQIQETLNIESSKEVFTEKIVYEELDALTRVAPENIVEKKPMKSLVDTAVGRT
jgi:hypothetical protein